MRGMGRTLKNIWWLLRIAWILARWDVLFPFRSQGFVPSVMFLANMVPRKSGLGTPGQRLAGALQALGPSFVKLGQGLSTRQDLVGTELATELSELQDHLPSFSAKEARATIESEFGVPLDSLFKTFTDEPVASASIAQVHFAVTASGDPVAVKVRRPGVVNDFERDIEFLYWLAELAERAAPYWRRLHLVDVIDAFAQSVAVEMDLRLEASAASELGQNFRGDTWFRVPAVDWERTSHRVLTLEWVEGISIDEWQTLIDAGHDLHVILEKTARAFFLQVFRDGFFHADLHPGNLMVNVEGNIVAVDFGIMGRLDDVTRRYLAKMLIAFLAGDYKRVAEIHYEAGYVPRRTPEAPFIQSLRAFGESILAKPSKDLSIAHLLAGLFQTLATFEMQTQPDLLLLQKAMFMAEGLTNRLTPDQNMWAVVRPLMESWAKDNLGVEARVKDTLSEVLEASGRLPRLLTRADLALERLEGSISAEPASFRPGIGRPRAPSALDLLLTLASELLPGLPTGTKHVSMLHILLAMIVCLLAALLVVQLL